MVKKHQGRKSRSSRPHQVGTSNVNIRGGEAAPCNVVIGNKHPDSISEIISDVLKKVSEQMLSEDSSKEPLPIVDVECLRKRREDGRRIWSKTWSVQVPNRFKCCMEKLEAYPSAWSCRKYFPPRAARPPIPDLDPTVKQPQPKSRIREPYPTSSLMTMELSNISFLSYKTTGFNLVKAKWITDLECRFCSNSGTF